jgi:hypothetical protein
VVVRSSPSADLVALIERALGHVVKVILTADDSDGLIGDVARELLELHGESCDAGVADPIKLARWMIRFRFEDQDFFEADPVRYAKALGEIGIAAYRREIRQRRKAGDDSFAANYAEERLAVLDGDVDRIVHLLGGDLSRPHQFIRVAEAMEELGRHDDVLDWALRGIAVTSGWAGRPAVRPGGGGLLGPIRASRVAAAPARPAQPDAVVKQLRVAAPGGRSYRSVGVRTFGGQGGLGRP